LADTIHATHTCYACGRPVAWVGDMFGKLTVSHGNEVDATVCVSKGANQSGQVELSVQFQCPDCHAVNQFKALHRISLTM
jgi:hypothetical protein